MGRSVSNDCPLQMSVEASLETLAGSPTWYVVPRNDITSFGAELDEEESIPHGKNRRPQASAITDLNSSVAFNDHLRLSTFRRFIPGFLFCTPTAPGGTDLAVFTPTAVVAAVAASLAFTQTGQPSVSDTVTINSQVYTFVSSLTGADDVLIGSDAEESQENLIAAINGASGEGTTYGTGTVANTAVTATKDSATVMTITAITAGAAGNSITCAEAHDQGSWAGAATNLASGVDAYYTVADDGDLAEGTLVYGRGHSNATNNGLKEVGSSSTTTRIYVVDATMVAEASPPSHAQVDVAGFRGASGDLEIDANGDLISTSLDFTTLDLLTGQTIGIGGEATANQFATSANIGLAQIGGTIEANKIPLSRTAAAFSVDDGSSKEIDIYFGEFLRDVDTDHANWLIRSHQFELEYPNLDTGDAAMYEYSKGNYANEFGLTMPQRGLISASYGFVGTDTDEPVSAGSRATNADSGIEQNQRQVFSTAIHYSRLRLADVDETGLSTIFQSWSLRLNNGVEPEKVQAKLGAMYMNYGRFMFNIDATMVFTSATVASRIRTNTRIAFDFAIQNDDGGIHFNMPSCRIGKGVRGFPANQSVTLSTTITAEEDSELGYAVGVSLFPYLPPSYKLATPA